MINESNIGRCRLEWGPRQPPRLPRYLSQTKTEVKELYCRDETLLWHSLTVAHGSVSGHIKHTLALTRNSIKGIHKNLAFEKLNQSVGNLILTGGLFKRIIDKTLVVPLCPVCATTPLEWEHFVTCFKLDQMSSRDIQDVEVISELARCVATYMEQE